jgi:hypothetical protein
MPFEPAAAMLAYFTNVEVGKDTVRRMTERAGAAYVVVQDAELARLERELPVSPAGPAVQQLSVDGAMVPLVGGEWAEVKTLAIGVVDRRLRDGKLEAYTRELSYFSRMTDHLSFARSAFVETHRRGTALAGVVAGIVDGADWEQTFLDLHRADAVRILDWGHASGYVAAAARAVFGQGTEASAAWLSVQLHELKHGDPEVVLAKLRGLRDDLALQEGRAEALEVVTTGLEYLEKRREMIRYAEFASAGLPIGSGIVESANKLVVEARLKGSGMHWARGNVDPMVALRNVACSDRWEEAWPQIARRLRRAPRQRSAERREARKAAKVALQQGAETAPVQPREPDELPKSQASRKARQAGPEAGGRTGPRPPSPDHPWRRMPIGKARRAA